MPIVGHFKITDSFKIIGRGLLAKGYFIEGRVEIGWYLTFNTGDRDVTLQIGGVSIGGSVSEKTSYVGLTFAYKDEQQQIALEGVKLPSTNRCDRRYGKPKDLIIIVATKKPRL